MTVLGDLANKRSCIGTVNSSNVVHAANNEMGTIRRPCQVIDLSTARPTHMFGSPRFLVFQTFGSEIGYRELARNPENHVAVITGRCKKFSFRGPTNDVDSLIMLGQGREVIDLTFFSVGFNLPDSDVVVTTCGC